MINVVKGGATPGPFAHELLAVSYAGCISPSFQLKVNQTFIDYRSGKLQGPAVPQTLPDAPRLAADLAEENQRVKRELLAQPKAQALDRIVTADGSMCITDAAKDLQVRPKDLFNWLSENRWIYRRPGGSHFGPVT